MMRVLSFDISGDYAHFRKYFTTSSPLTFSVIPPTTAYGIIAAILGVEKEDNFYLSFINGSTVRLAIGILKPIKKSHLGINHINTKGGIWVPKHRKEGARTQIRTELLKDISYRLYVHIKDQELLTRLYELTSQHKSIYTVSLGLSELLADISFHGYTEYYRKNSNSVQEIATVISLACLENQNIQFEAGKVYMKELLPLDMDRERVVKNYNEVLFEAQGQPIKAVVREYWENAQGEKIVFLPTWDGDGNG